MALANEGGGTIVLGVTDKRPRQVIGTSAFPEPGRTEAGLFEQLRQRIPIEEYLPRWEAGSDRPRPGDVFPEPRWQYKGSFWMRTGDALVPMSDEQLRRIHEETGPDFLGRDLPAAAHRGTSIRRLSTLLRRLVAAQVARTGHRGPAGGAASRGCRAARQAEALDLRGADPARHAGRPWVGIWRRPRSSSSIVRARSPGPAADRREFRRRFLPVLDEIWQLINLRNDLQHFQQGLFVWDVPDLQRARGAGGRAQRGEPSRLPPRRLRSSSGSILGGSRS